MSHLSLPSDPVRGATAMGFSLTEMLIVLGIIVVLVGILIPAIETSRRSARATHCLSNLHQIGVALHTYTTEHHNLPPSDLSGDEGNSFSPQARLVRYLKAGVHIESDPDAGSHEIEAYRCPSDPARRRGNAISYRACAGIATPWAPPGEAMATWKREGVFSPGWNIELEDIRDGASKTVAFSEHGIGDGNSRRITRESDIYEHIRKPSNPTADKIRAELLKLNYKKADQVENAGFGWITTSIFNTHYSHDALPNELSANVWTEGEYSDFFLGNIITAKSYHGKGANILLCDGSTRWVKNEIDPLAWRALATFQGGDTVDAY